jgi:hypothetical protein
MSTHSLPPNRTHRDLHFDLSWLGPTHEAEVYTLHIGGRPYRLAPHTPETLATNSPAGSPTHFATQVAVQTDTPQLLSVTVPPRHQAVSRPCRRSASTPRTTPAAIRSTTWRRPWCS